MLRATNDQDDYTERYWRTYGQMPIHAIYVKAAFSGHLDIMKWANINDPDKRDVNNFVSKTHFDNKITEIYESAALGGHPKIIEWLNKKYEFDFVLDMATKKQKHWYR